MDEIKKCFPHIDSMNGYESPVTLFEGPWHQIAEKISKDTDSFIFDSITSLGISIDKEELIKAIQYDRDQYSKGYENGYEAGYKAAMEDSVHQFYVNRINQPKDYYLRNKES